MVTLVDLCVWTGIVTVAEGEVHQENEKWADLLSSSTSSVSKSLLWSIVAFMPCFPVHIVIAKNNFQPWDWFQCVLCIFSEEMNRGLIVKFENLVQLRGACRQLRTVSYRKVNRAQWKPVQSSAYPVQSVHLYPQFWQKDKSISVALSQYRHLATTEVINKIQSSLIPCEISKYKKSIWALYDKKGELHRSYSKLMSQNVLV